MANIIPFRAIRPHRNKVSLVGSRSYINYSEKDFKEKLSANPYTFLHVITPTYGLKDHGNQTMLDRYREVRSRFEDFNDQGIFQRDTKPQFYVYQQIKQNHSFIGVIAGVSIDDFNTGHVKKHEHTLTKRESIFAQYLKETKINAEPVLLTYKHQDEIDSILKKYSETRPEYEFSTTDKTIHNLWLISNEEDIRKMQGAFQQVPDMYIADGHHRCASSARLSSDLRDYYGSEFGEAYDYFMAYLISDHQLNILPFNRLVSGLNGLTSEQLLAKIEESYTVTPLPKKSRPKQKHHIHMFLDNSWYKLVLNNDLIQQENIISQLDSHQLSETILNPILGIEDIKTDSRMHFYGGDKGLKGMEKMVRKGKADLAFALYPVEVEQLIEISDQGLTMPPKSTWIEPKLRSGLTIYSIFDH
ncbi:DUF1015 domain-containing protein [bacterium SCSIO 12643]|nr:DUF1015 domain-containing protein [bacterium SCSIO 12643]